MSKPLEGIKVLELSTFVAAPVCARLLSDMGANVIKVEHPAGDQWRATGVSFLPARFSADENPVFDIYNSGKKHIAINLKSPEGMEAFHKLLAQTDIFITNTRPDALTRLGLSYEQIKDRYPSLVYAMLVGYGEKGPEAKKPAFDTVAFWSKSGFMMDQSVAGENFMPVVPPSSVGDTVSGMFLMGEICAALFRRERTGKGDFVRSGLYHNGIFTMGTMVINSQKPFGRKYPCTREDHGVPGGYYCCADNEWVFIAAAYAATIIPKMCVAIGRSDLLENEEFMTASTRWQNRAKYYAIFRDAFLTKTSQEWEKIAEEMDFPLVRMSHYSDVSEDPQAWANGYLEHVEFANGRVDVMPVCPLEMDSVGEVKTIPAPGIGHDTKAVFTELGYTEEQIAALQASGAIK